jgi:adenylate cyclase
MYMNGVARHVGPGGIINKFIGDAIMALFGVPLSHTLEEEIDQDAVNAVECALQMRAEIKKLNADWTARGLPTTAMRVGIYTGPLVAGSMGSELRLEFTVLGDTVNTGRPASKALARKPPTTRALLECIDPHRRIDLPAIARQIRHAAY